MWKKLILAALCLSLALMTNACSSGPEQKNNNQQTQKKGKSAEDVRNQTENMKDLSRERADEEDDKRK